MAENSNQWQNPINSWEDVRRKFHLSDDRYVEFEFLLYLDIENEFIQNFVYYQLGTVRPIIVDKLKFHAQFWKSLKAPDSLLDIISNGLKIPFLVPPPPMFLPNSSSLKKPENKAWLLSTLKEFEEFGFISKVKDIPYCVLPLQIDQHPTKLSLIHDEKMLNSYVEKQKFKLEGWETMFESSFNAKFGIQFDIKKFYFHIPIHKDYRKYFGFSYRFPNDQDHSYFVFNVLPYGYTKAPLIARDLMKPLISKWRRLGINATVYFDDGFAVSNSKSFLKSASLQILCDLLRAGLTPGLGKCFWEPTLKLSWIGLQWDFGKAGLSIIFRRKEKLISCLNRAKHEWPLISYRDVSKITGLLNSMHPVFNGREQLRSRGLQNLINRMYMHEKRWDDIITTGTIFPSEFQLAEFEIDFWLKNFDKLNFRPFKEKIPTFLCWTDASSKAVAGILSNAPKLDTKQCLSIDNIFDRLMDVGYNSNSPRKHIDTLCDSATELQHIDTMCDSANLRDEYGFKIFHRMLNEHEKLTDSNERELIAAKDTIFGLYPRLKGSCVTIHLDNLNASNILRKGSSKLRLHKYALQVDDVCMRNGITIHSVHIPRDINKTADYLSKVVDFEDYSVNESFFELFQSEFDISVTIDRFADNFNTKVLTFNSRSYCVGSAGVDCFNYDWGLPSINWIFPPPRLLIKSLNHLLKSKGVGLILTPDWKGSSFYPYFHSDIFRPYLVKKKVYRPSRKMFKQGSDKDSFFGPDFNCAVLLWLFDFSDNDFV